MDRDAVSGSRARPCGVTQRDQARGNRRLDRKGGFGPCLRRCAWPTFHTRCPSISACPAFKSLSTVLKEPILLESFFQPKSVAIIGASSSPEKLGHVVLKNAVESGYNGTLYPINPKGGM